LKYRLSFGILTGYSEEKTESNTEFKNNTKAKGLILGGYAFYNPWYDGRIDVLYLLNKDKNTQYQRVGQNLNQQTYQSKTDTFDMMISQVIRVSGDILSFRFNVGNTIILNDTNPYTIGTIHNAHNKGISKEIYGGIGIRINERNKNMRIRVTFVYEKGKEYCNTNHSPQKTLSGILPITVPSTEHEKTNTDYFSANASILLENNWKFIVTYNGAFKNDSQNHTVMTKFEYRF
ncbi:MAG: hypothetical protein KBD31_02775, partial [Proteobacteria bacterium]|nr:hypothetical protein [Pseudomonadota bacterium]